MSALGVTAYAFVIGNLIAIAVGVPLGILMGRSVHRRPHLPALGEPLPLRAADRARAGHHGAVRPRPDDHHPDRRALRHLDHRARRARRRALHLALAGRDGEKLRREPLAGLLAHLCLGGAAGDPRRHPARRDPRREGRHHRPAARLHRRLRRALQALRLALPDGAFLGGAARPLRLRLPAGGRPCLAGAPGRVLRRQPRANNSIQEKVSRR